MVRRDDPLPPTMAMAFDDFAPHEDDPWGDVEHLVEPVEERAVPFVGVDPRLMRIGAVALAGVLMIPLALALREDADGGLRSETLAATDSTVATTVADASTTTALTVPVTAAAIAPVAAATPVTAAATAPPTASRAPAGQAVAVAEPVCAGRYTVIFNDYWNRFPKTSGASVEEWLEANHATPDSPLYVGDELCIPPGAQAPAPPPPPTTEPPAATAAPTTQAAAPTQAPATMAAPVVTPAPTAASVVTQPRRPPHPDTRAIAADPGRSGRCRDDHPRGVAGRARGTGADDRPARELVAPRGLQRDMLLRVVPDPFPGEPHVPRHAGHHVGRPTPRRPDQRHCGVCDVPAVGLDAVADH